MLVAIKLNAGNTPIGNPQRVFVVFELEVPRRPGGVPQMYIVDAIDEGYRGVGST